MESYSYTNCCILCAYVPKKPGACTIGWHLLRRLISLRICIRNLPRLASPSCFSLSSPLFRIRPSLLYTTASDRLRVFCSHIYYILHTNQSKLQLFHPIDCLLSRHSFSFSNRYIHLGYRSTPHVAYSVSNNSILFHFDWRDRATGP